MLEGEAKALGALVYIVAGGQLHGVIAGDT